MRRRQAGGHRLDQWDRGLAAPGAAIGPAKQIGDERQHDDGEQHFDLRQSEGAHQLARTSGQTRSRATLIAIALALTGAGWVSVR